MLMRLHQSDIERIAANWPALKLASSSAPDAAGFVMVDVPALPEFERAKSGMGDRLALFLHRLGFRKWQGCGCAKRQAWLNRFGQNMAMVWKRLFDKN